MPRAADSPKSRPVVGVMAPLVAGPYFGPMVAEIAEEVEAAGGSLLVLQALSLASGGPRPTGGALALDRRGAVTGAQAGCTGTGRAHVDGVIVLPGGASRACVQRLHSSGLPVVLSSWYLPDLQAHVCRPDTRQAANMLVEHLVSHGRQRIAFVGDVRHPGVGARYAAYKAALAAAGLPATDALLVPVSSTLADGGEAAAARIASASPRFDAVVAGTDSNAIGLMGALATMGIDVPADLAVVSFGDTTEAMACRPALTTVGPSLAKVAARSAKWLLGAVAQDGERRERAGVDMVAPNLALRESCGCKAASPLVPHGGHQDAGKIETAADVPGTVRARAVLEANLAEHWPGATGTARDLLAGLAEHMCSATTVRQMAELPARLADLASTTALDDKAPEVVLSVAKASRHMAKAIDNLVAPGARDGVPELLGQLSDVCTRALLHRAAVAKAATGAGTRAAFDVSLDLMAHEDPGGLSWLAGTSASAACFATWVGRPGPEAPLKVVGTCAADSRSSEGVVGTTVGNEQFPPAWMLASRPGEAVFVVPVASQDKDWGVLAVRGPVLAAGNAERDQYYEWGALLAIVLDHREALAELNDDRSKLTELASRVAKSEQRYALAAQATNDGLWDWQLDSGTVYFSRRFRELLGTEPAGPGDGQLSEWTGAVHPDDLAELQIGLNDLANAAGSPSMFEYEHRLVPGPDGDQRWLLCKAMAVPNPDGRTTRLVGSVRDVTARKRLEEELEHKALYDSLTGLANRALLADRITQAIEAKRRDSTKNFAVLWLDLDRFKMVNDSMGHPAGDLLLKDVAARLRSQVRPTDTVSRRGGDEFVILVNPTPPGPMGLENMVSRLQAEISAPYAIEGQEVCVSASVGVVTSAIDYSSTEDILRDADLAMYRAKQSERGSCAMFSATMRSAVQVRFTEARALRKALARGELTVYYQPIVDLRSGSLAGMEALVRWPRPDGSLVPPAEFLPAARESGLMTAVGELVLTKTCAQTAEWVSSGKLPAGARISVNISNEEFWHNGFLRYIDTTVAGNHLDPRALVLEITEGIVMADINSGLFILRELRDRGFELHIDDFGTGHSSLEALRDLPVQALKIDRGFITGSDRAPKSAALVRAMVQMAKALDLKVVAEGIEAKTEAELLAKIGCDYGQGYLLGRPAPADLVLGSFQEFIGFRAIAAIQGPWEATEALPTGPGQDAVGGQLLP